MASIVKKSDVIGVSVGSLTFCLVAEVIILMFAVINRVGDTQLLNILLGKDASTTLIQASEESVLSRVDQVLGNEQLGRSTVFLVWMFIGLVIYAAITAVGKASQQVKDAKVQMHFIHTDKASFSKAIKREVIFRTGVALGWVIFTLICLNLLLPFVFAALAIVFGDSVLPGDWLSAMIGVVCLFMALHLHVILARLFFGRVRLFGS